MSGMSLKDCLPDPDNMPRRNAPPPPFNVKRFERELQQKQITRSDQTVWRVGQAAELSEFQLDAHANGEKEVSVRPAARSKLCALWPTCLPLCQSRHRR